CLAALVLVRFLSVRDHPAFVPQVMPLRLDMWVVLVLAVDRFGLRSWKTALTFALVYAGDATFGFLFAAIYCAALGADFLSKRERPTARLLARNGGPLAVVALFQKLVFGSFVSPAALKYVDVQLGFMPIAETSLFWPIALLLGWATAVFVAHRHRRASLF